jgi:Arc/MetJ-type ribon-helix-helix transcriptional regulator
MTIHLPEDLAGSIRAEVLSGHFASEEDMVAVAVRVYLRREHTQAPPAAKSLTQPAPRRP